MADHITNNEKKSKPIVSFDLDIPLRFSISGDEKFEKDLKEFLIYINDGKKEKCPHCNRYLKKYSYVDILVDNILSEYHLTTMKQLALHPEFKNFFSDVKNEFWKTLRVKSERESPLFSEVYRRMFYEDKNVQKFLKDKVKNNEKSD